ncbi:MAG: RDD family protein [Ornithinibacter sp.]
MSTRDISPVPREARPYQGAPAGVVTRVVANILDALVVAVALGVGYIGWASVVFLRDPRSFEFPSVSLLFSLTAAMGVTTVYFWLAWWLAGRTYGGHVLGLRVHGRLGRRLGPLRALVRAAFCVFFPIGLFWCVISPQRRSVQDLVLWTTVVYDWLPREPGVDHHPRGSHEVTPPEAR